MDLPEGDWTIGQMVDRYPETRAVLVNNGFPLFADNSVLAQLGPVLKLKTALRSKGLSERLFMQLLRDKIAEAGNCYRPEDERTQTSERLNLLTLLPCPLKVPLQGELRFILEHLQREQGIPLNYNIDISANKQVNYADYIKYFEEPDELPDVILTTGYDIFCPDFIKRFVNTGVFARLPQREVNPRLAAAGIVDPDGRFTVIAVNPLVMAVDQNRLGQLAMPRVWSDLLKPEYEDQIVMRGHGDIFCDVLQLNYYKEYGERGLRALARAVKYGRHPAQMVRELSSRGTAVPPIHIMPRFFAEMLRERSNVKLIWPEDGAMAYPVSLLVKADKLSEMQQLTDYLTGPVFARICDDAFFPAVYSDGSSLPAAAAFKWTGWDYIKSRNIEQLIGELNSQFLAALRMKGDRS